MNLREMFYQFTQLRNVVHTTLNPKEPGVVRIHMIPPKWSLRQQPYVIILNGAWVLPINVAWAILLSNFIKEVNYYQGTEISDQQLKAIERQAVLNTKKVYYKTNPQRFHEDLWNIISTLCDIAYERTPQIDIGQMSIREYAPNMAAPHRMDLMISAMVNENGWHCNQRCIHCYAAGQYEAKKQELTTSQWKKVIDICRKSNIPQLTFTGGEPTMRKDLVELIEHAKWFVTRLNTNGVQLTKNLCEQLYKASLDSVQITFYSYDEEIHNHLVGASNFSKTVQGIRNAVGAGLNVSINTPLCSINKDYVKTLEMLHKEGICYVTCSSLIITGNAKTDKSRQTQLSEQELYAILKEASQFCKEAKMEITFTSPGWLSEEQLQSIGLSVPACGACLSNMAIAPDGTVVPCQSWLNQKAELGNILQTPWHKIWNNPKAKKIRNMPAGEEQKCPLRSME